MILLLKSQFDLEFVYAILDIESLIKRVVAMEANIVNVKLVMWERVDMPESKPDGKGGFMKTGVVEEHTLYKFRDLLGTVISVQEKGNKYRDLEGKNLDLRVLLVEKEFGGKRTKSWKILSAAPVK
jgi:hypothetical protein